MGQQIATVVGGTGFVGRYVVRELARAGWTVRVISRHPELAQRLKTAGTVGQVVLMYGDLADPETLIGKFDNSNAVINLVGILAESGSQRFTKLHAQGAEKVAQLARAAGAQRFVQVSALGADRVKGSKYARSKLLGERAVMTAFPEATILRPSVIFGPEDHFFNLFAQLASFLPILPAVGAKTRVQPVYVGDVARAIVACLNNPDAPEQTYELGGPATYTYRQIMEYILRTTERHRPIFALPFGLASLKAISLQYMPYPLKLTRDQVRLLRVDNVVSPGALTLSDLGIEGTAVEMVVPEYLSRFVRKKAA